MTQSWRSSTHGWANGCFAVPPPVLRRPGRVWQLVKALYGTRPASKLWQAHIGEMFENAIPPWRRVGTVPRSILLVFHLLEKFHAFFDLFTSLLKSITRTLSKSFDCKLLHKEQIWILSLWEFHICATLGVEIDPENRPLGLHII